MPSTSAPRNEFGLSEAAMDSIREICGRFPRISQVIVYGSRAMGTFREGSDIDMTVIADEGFTKNDLHHMADAFDDSMLPYLVDLSIFAELKSPELKDHIRRRGKVLYARGTATEKGADGMHYGTIKKFDIADGLGVRVSLFVSGCRNHCAGCQNRETWDFVFGRQFTPETEREILDALAPDYIAGLTVLGGEPFEEENQRTLAPFLEKVRAAYPQKTIWCYTGYLYETDLLAPDGRKHCDVTDRMLACIDVLVDGPYIASLRDLSLDFRGSSNQRILHLTPREQHQTDRNTPAQAGK